MPKWVIAVSAKSLALALLLLAALAIRLYAIDEPVVRFHPTRHYRSAVLAHACYVDHVASEPWVVAVAHANREMQPVGELPVMEWLACGGYLLVGRETIVLPRVVIAAIWVSGAVPLWLLALRMSSSGGAWLAVVLYLFLPYGIIASRNFQPDPLMTCASLWAVLALFRSREKATTARLVQAAIGVGAAGLVKPMSVFLTVPAVLALAPSVGSAAMMIAAGLALPMSYYGYQAIAGSLVRDQMHMRFVPLLFGTAFFWNGLATQAGRVMTLPLLAAAVIGALTAPTALARRLLVALFGGYALFAVAFTYHMPTHDYYHLPYLAVVALAIGALFARAESLLPAAPWSYISAVLCFSIVVTGSVVAWPRLRVSGASGFSQMYKEIGELTAHDTRALFLDTEYGYALMYHGQISGDAWPNTDDLAAEALDGRPPIDAEARFERDYAAFRPNYFIATDLASFEASPGLQAMLGRRATAVRITETYRVYRFDGPR